MRGVEGEGGVGGAMVTLCCCFSLQCTAASDIDLDDILKNFEGIFCGRLVHSGVSMGGWREAREEGGGGGREEEGEEESETKWQKGNKREGNVHYTYLLKINS